MKTLRSSLFVILFLAVCSVNVWAMTEGNNASLNSHTSTAQAIDMVAAVVKCAAILMFCLLLYVKKNRPFKELIGPAIILGVTIILTVAADLYTHSLMVH